ncbi:protein FAM221B-like [Scyliorhinus canicula]|uniref:protein FAM221B-like n=1 Tax=Scyliorhinus canicula TaxID=7830 RepID=UPI0018F51298|nr:protein FAM221B-like [Scyliorhinus canicula]XP_038646648.1 protein FAM221B-like [Scyliorhinus canicula]
MSSGQGPGKQKAKTQTVVHESNQTIRGSKTDNTSGASQALVPHQPSQAQQQNTMLVPKGYTVKPIVPAEKAELISVAKAMHREQFGARVKELFDPEREAALEALQTGIYIGWRCPEYKWDCIRVGVKSKCFCGHLLAEHERFTGTSVRVPCVVAGCQCRAYAFIPSRPEDVGEFWLRKRRNFDPSAWRAKCRCKHNHEEHNVGGSHSCKAGGCSCPGFDSNFLCAACDKHWEQHQTFFETEAHRKEAGLPYGEAYLPFAEMPNLRNAVLSGKEEDDSAYQAITSGTGSYSRLGPSSNSSRPALPPDNKPRRF